MVNLMMKVGRTWHDVGEYDNIEAAEFCCFDSTKDYEIRNENGVILESIKKAFASFREAI